MGRDGRGVAPASETSIQITFQYRGERCREKIPLKPTAANLKRAEQHRQAILHAISAGTFDYAATFPGSPRAAKFAAYKGQVITVGDHLDAWLAAQKQHLKASSWEGYAKIVNNVLVPGLGTHLMTELSRRHVRELMDDIDAGNKRLANIQSVLRAAMTAAVNDDLIELNPMHGWTYARRAPPKPRDEIDPFSPEEQAAILLACQPAMANMVRFLLWSGLRTSEMIALNWSDIDQSRGVVIVDKALTQAADEPEDTKTRAGRREVKLLGPARDALRDQKALTYVRGEDGPIFVHPNTMERWNGDQQVRKAWIPVLKKAQVRYRRPYQTRHTYASMMLSAGEHPMWVAKQMGHSDWTMIARIYGRWMPAADLGAGSKAEEKFSTPERQRHAG